MYFFRYVIHFFKRLPEVNYKNKMSFAENFVSSKRIAPFVKMSSLWKETHPGKKWLKRNEFEEMFAFFRTEDYSFKFDKYTIHLCFTVVSMNWFGFFSKARRNEAWRVLNKMILLLKNIWYSRIVQNFKRCKPVFWHVGLEIWY